MELAIIIVCLLVVVVWLLRKLRAREVAAFMKAETDAATELLSASAQAGAGKSVSKDRATSQAALSDDAILLKRAALFLQRASRSTQGAPRSLQATEKGSGYKLKARVLPEYMAAVAVRLENALTADVTILFNQPLTEFVVPRPDLERKTLSVLIAETVSYKLIAGIEFRPDVTSLELQLLDKAFRQIDKPLFVFSKPAKLSEINECASRLNSLQSGLPNKSVKPYGQPRKQRATKHPLKTANKPVSNLCPNCRGVMQQKQVNINADELTKVWICNDYPSCKRMLFDDSV